jgi:dimethylhistidine N-methyltransferase
MYIQESESRIGTNLSSAQRSADTLDAMRREIIGGLVGLPKRISSKYLYDAEGSRLFEAICVLPEYYVTRTEMALLSQCVQGIAEHIPEAAVLIEFGSGASIKTRLLLDAIPQIEAYVPIDISGDALTSAVRSIRTSYPDLRIEGVVADIGRMESLPVSTVGYSEVGFFPGSTIGNYTPMEAKAFLANARRILGAESRFIVGVDLVKSLDVLIPAYDDAQGVTAAFNKNVLTRLNREHGANFRLGDFQHKAIWNPQESRIEMHLVSLRDSSVTLGDGTCIPFARGATIHTENSYKYVPVLFERLALDAGWNVEKRWTSTDPAFGIFLLA